MKFSIILLFKKKKKDVRKTNFKTQKDFRINDSEKEVPVLPLSLLANKNVKYVEVHTSN